MENLRFDAAKIHHQNYSVTMLLNNDVTVHKKFYFL